MDSYRYVVSDLYWYEILVQYHVNEYRATRGNQYEKNTHLVFLRGGVGKEETFSICPKIKTKCLLSIIVGYFKLHQQTAIVQSFPLGKFKGTLSPISR